MSPQYTPQNPPLSPRSVRGALRRIRALCDLIEAHAGATEPHEKATVTRAIHGLAHTARDLSRRHRGVSVAEELRS